MSITLHIIPSLVDPEVRGVVPVVVVDEVVSTPVGKKCCFAAFASVTKHSVCRNYITTHAYAHINSHTI